eukprot:227104_1
MDGGTVEVMKVMVTLWMFITRGIWYGWWNCGESYEGYGASLKKVGHERVGYQRVGYKQVEYKRGGHIKRVGHEQVGYKRIAYKRVGHTLGSERVESKKKVVEQQVVNIKWVNEKKK